MDISEFRQLKLHGITNKSFYEDIKDDILEAEQAIVVTVDKEGLVDVIWTGGHKTMMLGALDWAKKDVMGTLTEDDIE